MGAAAEEQEEDFCTFWNEEDRGSGGFFNRFCNGSLLFSALPIAMIILNASNEMAFGNFSLELFRRKDDSTGAVVFLTPHLLNYVYGSDFCGPTC